MLKCFVTGCAGFIGSHLADKLLSLGYQVVGIDSFSEYYNPEFKERNLQSALQSDRFKLIREDLITSDLVNSILEYDYIFHLAAQPGVRTSWGNSFKAYVDNNILVTQRLLEYSKGSNKLKKFFYASSSSVYGEIKKESVCEDDALNPFSPYGVTKLAAENLCELYRKNYGLPTLSLRFFTVYGPRQRPDMAFSRLIKSALTGESFDVFGNGDKIRDFTYISDVIDGILLSAFAENILGVYNIAGGSVVSVNDVISELTRIIKREIKINYLSNEKGDVSRTAADISRLTNLTGFIPKIDLPTGLNYQLDYQKNYDVKK